MGVEAADGDARGRDAEELDGFVAELDGADDARGCRGCVALRREVWVVLWTTENLTPARSMRESATPWRCGAEVGDVFGVAAEGEAGEADGFFVEWAR